MALTLAQWIGKVAVVTGTSSGIGEAIAIKLVEQGIKVKCFCKLILFIFPYIEDRLETLAQRLEGKRGKFYSVETDISKEDDIVKAFTWTTQNVGPVHILINNAGIYRYGNISDFKFEEAKEIMNVNVIGLATAAREALKIFQKENINGHIININSIAGHRVLNADKITLYNASKHAVTALTESLYLEMNRKHTGTKITSIRPGLVETEIVDTKIFEKAKANENQPNPLKADDIADAVAYVLSTPPNCQVDELIIRPIVVRT